ncbi:hypothetical protein A1F97_11034, partial [Pyrenophora tritici-repentis]
MTPFTTAKLLSLRASLSAHPDQEVLRSYFKGSSSNPLSSAVLVTLHRKWTTHPPSAATGPPPFHFGTTIYVTLAEALDMLHAIWHQPVDEDNFKAGFKPIVYMAFGSNDAVGKIRRPAFDFDPSGFDTTVATLDAQIIPQQAKITRHADANLNYLLAQFKLKLFDEENAGNAAVYTTA